MKTKIILTAFLLIMAVPLLNAQSDYQTTQNFKSQWKEIRESIRGAKTSAETESAEKKIDGLKNDYQASKDLLDKSLYPETFESSLSQLTSEIDFRKGDFVQITELSNRVTEMENTLKTLTAQNESLLRQIEDLNKVNSKNETELVKLNTLVAQLKNNLKQRDQLVRELVDGVLAEFNKSAQVLQGSEKQSLLGKIKKSNLFYNVANSIESNIKFIDATAMTANDLTEMNREFVEFKRIWSQIGPKLASVYLTNKKNSEEIKSIDTLFNGWNTAMNAKILDTVNKLFLDRGIRLNPFNNGDQLVHSLDSYVNSEINSVNNLSSREAENNFNAFANDVYFKSLKQDWFPLLIKANLISQSDQDIFESNIAKWQSKISPSYTNVLYYAAGALFAGLILFFLLRTRIKIV